MSEIPCQGQGGIRQPGDNSLIDDHPSEEKTSKSRNRVAFVAGMTVIEPGLSQTRTKQDDTDQDQYFRRRVNTAEELEDGLRSLSN